MQQAFSAQSAQNNGQSLEPKPFVLPDYAGRTFLVLGLGESGLAMVRWLVRCGASVRVADSRDTPPGRDQLQAACPDVVIHCGAFTPALLAGVDVVAVSPGVAIKHPLLDEARALGLQITGEIELFAQALQHSGERARCKVIAITGTNGKTTTTTLTGELVRACGRDAGVAGNISPAALDELMRRIDAGKLPEVWVLELSSFQMETTRTLNAEAATVLNVTDDHLDRHGSLAQYAAEKARVFDGQGVQVVNAEDAYSLGMLRQGRQQVRFSLAEPLSEADFGTRMIDGVRWMVQGAQPLMATRDLRLAGNHNVANVLAALALCRAIGLPMDVLLQAAREFRGLAHRVERVAQREDGVVFYDDSKGTNVGATLAALQGLGCPVVLIAGGDGKGQDFSPLREAFGQHARAVVLIGRDAGLIEAQTAGSGAAMIHAGDMHEAVNIANQQARSGDAVLLSPACASWDMFKGYAHRSQVFIEAVLNLPGVKA